MSGETHNPNTGIARLAGDNIATRLGVSQLLELENAAPPPAASAAPPPAPGAGALLKQSAPTPPPVAAPPVAAPATPPIMPSLPPAETAPPPQQPAATAGGRDIPQVLPPLTGPTAQALQAAENALLEEEQAAAVFTQLDGALAAQRQGEVVAAPRISAAREAQDIGGERAVEDSGYVGYTPTPIPQAMFPPAGKYDVASAQGERGALAEISANIERAGALFRQRLEAGANSAETAAPLQPARGGGYFAALGGGNTPAVGLLLRSRATGEVYENPPLNKLAAGLYQAYGLDNKPMGDVVVRPNDTPRIFWGGGQKGYWTRLGSIFAARAKGTGARLLGGFANLGAANMPISDETKERWLQTSLRLANYGDVVSNDMSVGDLPPSLIDEKGDVNITAAGIAGVMADVAPSYIPAIGVGLVAQTAARKGLRFVGAPNVQARAAAFAAGSQVLFNSAQVAAMVAAETTERLIAKGMEPGEALERARGASAAGAALGLFSGRMAYSAGRLAPGMLREGAQEAFEESAELLIAASAAGDVVGGRELSESALAGAIGGGGMGAISDVGHGSVNWGRNLWATKVGREYIIQQARSKEEQVGYGRLAELVEKHGEGILGLGYGRLGVWWRAQLGAWPKKTAEAEFFRQHEAYIRARGMQNGADLRDIDDEARDTANMWKWFLAVGDDLSARGGLMNGKGIQDKNNMLSRAVADNAVPPEAPPRLDEGRESATDYQARLLRLAQEARQEVIKAVGRRLGTDASEMISQAIELGRVSPRNRQANAAAARAQPPPPQPPQQQAAPAPAPADEGGGGAAAAGEVSRETPPAAGAAAPPAAAPAAKPKAADAAKSQKAELDARLAKAQATHDRFGALIDEDIDGTGYEFRSPQKYIAQRIDKARAVWAATKDLVKYQEEVQAAEMEAQMQIDFMGDIFPSLKSRMEGDGSEAPPSPAEVEAAALQAPAPADVEEEGESSPPAAAAPPVVRKKRTTAAPAPTPAEVEAQAAARPPQEIPAAPVAQGNNATEPPAAPAPTAQESSAVAPPARLPMWKKSASKKEVAEWNALQDELAPETAKAEAALARAKAAWEKLGAPEPKPDFETEDLAASNMHLALRGREGVNKNLQDLHSARRSRGAMSADRERWAFSGMESSQSSIERAAAALEELASGKPPPKPKGGGEPSGGGAPPAAPSTPASPPAATPPAGGAQAADEQGELSLRGDTTADRARQRFDAALADARAFAEDSGINLEDDNSHENELPANTTRNIEFAAQETARAIAEKHGDEAGAVAEMYANRISENAGDPTKMDAMQTDFDGLQELYHNPQQGKMSVEEAAVANSPAKAEYLRLQKKYHAAHAAADNLAQRVEASAAGGAARAEFDFWRQHIKKRSQLARADVDIDIAKLSKSPSSYFDEGEDGINPSITHETEEINAALRGMTAAAEKMGVEVMADEKAAAKAAKATMYNWRRADFAETNIRKILEAVVKKHKASDAMWKKTLPARKRLGEMRERAREIAGEVDSAAPAAAEKLGKEAEAMEKEAVGIAAKMKVELDADIFASRFDEVAKKQAAKDKAAERAEAQRKWEEKQDAQEEDEKKAQKAKDDEWEARLDKAVNSKLGKEARERAKPAYDEANEALNEADVDYEKAETGSVVKTLVNLLEGVRRAQSMADVAEARASEYDELAAAASDPAAAAAAKEIAAALRAEGSKITEELVPPLLAQVKPLASAIKKGKEKALEPMTQERRYDIIDQKGVRQIWAGSETTEENVGRLLVIDIYARLDAVIGSTAMSIVNKHIGIEGDRGLDELGPLGDLSVSAPQKREGGLVQRRHVSLEGMAGDAKELNDRAQAISGEYQMVIASKKSVETAFYEAKRRYWGRTSAAVSGTPKSPPLLAKWAMEYSAAGLDTPAEIAEDLQGELENAQKSIAGFVETARYARKIAEKHNLVKKKATRKIIDDLAVGADKAVAAFEEAKKRADGVATAPTRAAAVSRYISAWDKLSEAQAAMQEAKEAYFQNKQGNKELGPAVVKEREAGQKDPETYTFPDRGQARERRRRARESEKYQAKLEEEQAQEAAKPAAPPADKPKDGGEGGNDEGNTGGAQSPPAAAQAPKQAAEGGNAAVEVVYDATADFMGAKDKNLRIRTSQLPKGTNKIVVKGTEGASYAEKDEVHIELDGGADAPAVEVEMEGPTQVFIRGKGRLQNYKGGPLILEADEKGGIVVEGDLDIGYHYSKEFHIKNAVINGNVNAEAHNENDVAEFDGVLIKGSVSYNGLGAARLAGAAVVEGDFVHAESDIPRLSNNSIVRGRIVARDKDGSVPTAEEVAKRERAAALKESKSQIERAEGLSSHFLPYVELWYSAVGDLLRDLPRRDQDDSRSPMVKTMAAMTKHIMPLRLAAQKAKKLMADYNAPNADKVKIGEEAQKLYDDTLPALYELQNAANGAAEGIPYKQKANPQLREGLQIIKVFINAVVLPQQVAAEIAKVKADPKNENPAAQKIIAEIEKIPQMIARARQLVEVARLRANKRPFYDPKDKKEYAEAVGVFYPGGYHASSLGKIVGLYDGILDTLKGNKGWLSYVKQDAPKSDISDKEASVKSDIADIREALAELEKKFGKGAPPPPPATPPSAPPSPPAKGAAADKPAAGGVQPTAWDKNKEGRAVVTAARQSGEAITAPQAAFGDKKEGDVVMEGAGNVLAGYTYFQKIMGNSWKPPKRAEFPAALDKLQKAYDAKNTAAVADALADVYDALFDWGAGDFPKSMSNTDVGKWRLARYGELQDQALMAIGNVAYFRRVAEGKPDAMSGAEAYTKEWRMDKAVIEAKSRHEREAARLTAVARGEIGMGDKRFPPVAPSDYGRAKSYFFVAHRNADGELLYYKHGYAATEDLAKKGAWSDNLEGRRRDMRGFETDKALAVRLAERVAKNGVPDAFVVEVKEIVNSDGETQARARQVAWPPAQAEADMASRAKAGKPLAQHAKGDSAWGVLSTTRADVADLILPGGDLFYAKEWLKNYNKLSKMLSDEGNHKTGAEFERLIPSARAAIEATEARIAELRKTLDDAENSGGKDDMQKAQVANAKAQDLLASAKKALKAFPFPQNEATNEAARAYGYMHFGLAQAKRLRQRAGTKEEESAWTRGIEAYQRAMTAVEALRKHEGGGVIMPKGWDPYRQGGNKNAEARAQANYAFNRATSALGKIGEGNAKEQAETADKVVTAAAEVEKLTQEAMKGKPKAAATPAAAAEARRAGARRESAGRVVERAAAARQEGKVAQEAREAATPPSEAESARREMDKWERAGGPVWLGRALAGEYAAAAEMFEREGNVEEARRLADMADKAAKQMKAAQKQMDAARALLTPGAVLPAGEVEEARLKARKTLMGFPIYDALYPDSPEMHDGLNLRAQQMGAMAEAQARLAASKNAQEKARIKAALASFERILTEQEKLRQHDGGGEAGLVAPRDWQPGITQAQQRDGPRKRANAAANSARKALRYMWAGKGEEERNAASRYVGEEARNIEGLVRVLMDENANDYNPELDDGADLASALPPQQVAREARAAALRGKLEAAGRKYGVPVRVLARLNGGLSGLARIRRGEGSILMSAHADAMRVFGEELWHAVADLGTGASAELVAAVRKAGGAWTAANPAAAREVERSVARARGVGAREAAAMEAGAKWVAHLAAKPGTRVRAEIRRAMGDNAAAVWLERVVGAIKEFFGLLNTAGDREAAAVLRAAREVAAAAQSPSLFAGNAALAGVKQDDNLRPIKIDVEEATAELQKIRERLGLPPADFDVAKHRKPKKDGDKELAAAGDEKKQTPIKIDVEEATAKLREIRERLGLPPADFDVAKHRKPKKDGDKELAAAGDEKKQTPIKIDVEEATAKLREIRERLGLPPADFDVAKHRKPKKDGDKELAAAGDEAPKSREQQISEWWEDTYAEEHVLGFSLGSPAIRGEHKFTLGGNHQEITLAFNVRGWFPQINEDAALEIERVLQEKNDGDWKLRVKDHSYKSGAGSLYGHSAPDVEVVIEDGDILRKNEFGQMVAEEKLDDFRRELESRVEGAMEAAIMESNPAVPGIAKLQAQIRGAK